MCCGSRRAAWRQGPARPAVVANGGAGEAEVRQDGVRQAEIAGSPSPFHAVTVLYTEGTAIRVMGPVTGQPYAFSPADPVQAVDARDAAVLTRGGVFVRR